jgi:glycolate oxidase iron-sulfur subunit
MTSESSQSEISKIDKELLDACVHCGICLPACPTYLATGRETESPRGRIYLLSLWQEGKLPFSDRLAEHIDSCLGCLGCQTACPSLVKYDQILNKARAQLADTKDPKPRAVMRFVFSKVLPNYPLLQKLGLSLRLAQHLRMRQLIGWAAKILPYPLILKLQRWESYLPALPKFAPLPRQSWSVGPKQGKAQLFTGCIMDVFYNDVNHCALRLLHKQAQVVEVPKQTCCGALAYHAGETDIALQLAKQNVEFFSQYDGPIVVTSSGCGAMLKDYSKLFADQKLSVSWQQRAQQFASRIQDLSQFLASHQFPEAVLASAKSPAQAITYHAACHLFHAQKVSEPEILLQQLAAAVRRNAGQNDILRLVPLQEAEHCCGSAGTYNLQQADLSDQILSRKIACLKQTGADLVVSSNPGCLLQIEAGLRQAGMPMRVLHLAQLLDQAYCH